MARDDASAFAARMQQLLYNLARNYEVCEEMCVARHGMTASQSYTLLAFPEESALTMTELSAAMGLTNSTMTTMADHLLRKGLIYRRQDNEDRRVVRVGLTEKGKEIRFILEKERRDILQGILEEIQDDEQLAILYSLEKVTKLIAKRLRTCCSS